MLSRTPPATVLDQLRREAGFVCARPDCMSPWLRWHHFDPPWREEHLHRPDGMIGLCAEHADAADGDAYTVEELREWKRRGRGDKDVVGFFEWMRADLAVVMGTCIFPGAMIALEIRGEPSIWLTASSDGPLVLNVRMPTVSDEPRLGVYNNWFVADETPEGMMLRCPPIGHRKIEVEYASRDRLAIEFLQINSRADFARLFGESENDVAPPGGPPEEDVEPPGSLAAAKIELRIPAADIEIDPEAIRLGGLDLRHVFIAAPVGLAFGPSPRPAGWRFNEGDFPPNLRVAPQAF